MSDYFAPENDGHMQAVRGYVELQPEADYRHTSEAARQAFYDWKFGVRIHWGLYSLNALQGESWPFLQMDYSERQAYQQLYRQFNPQGFHADDWMAFFQRAGLKCFAITTKHHEGFSLFATKTHVRQRINWAAPGGPQLEACDQAYSVMDAPFQRDIIAELCDAGRRWGMKIDFYFSHPDWYDADFRPYSYHPLQTDRVYRAPQEYGDQGYVEDLNKRIKNILVMPEPSPEATDRMIQRHRAQLIELLTNYGPIDMVCLDMWLGQPAWPQLRETIKLIRQLQPEVMLRIRGIGNYGDYYTPEGYVPGAPGNTAMPWMVIYPLGRTFSYDPLARGYKGARWLIHNLVDVVAKGGNFMPGIGPDAEGRFHPRAIQDLEAAGAWLRVNGVAIYATRPWRHWRQGQSIRYTCSKDGQTVYATSLRWPGRRLRLKSVRLGSTGQVRLLGIEQPLAWRNTSHGLVVELPESLQTPAQRPCRYAYSFAIEGI